MRKNEHFAGIPSIQEKKEHDRTLLYYSTPATPPVLSYYTFPYFSSTLFHLSSREYGGVSNEEGQARS